MNLVSDWKFDESGVAGRTATTSFSGMWGRKDNDCNPSYGSGGRLHLRLLPLFEWNSSDACITN